jgi:hypothetical protein
VFKFFAVWVDEFAEFDESGAFEYERYLFTPIFSPSYNVDSFHDSDAGTHCCSATIDELLSWFESLDENRVPVFVDKHKLAEPFSIDVFGGPFFVVHVLFQCGIVVIDSNPFKLWFIFGVCGGILVDVCFAFCCCVCHGWVSFV